MIRSFYHRFKKGSMSLGFVFSSVLLLTAFQHSSADELSNALTALINRHDGQVGVSIKHLKTGQEYRHRADQPMPTASLIKLPIMIEAFHQAHEGKNDFQKKITLRDVDKVPGSGVLTDHFSAGTQITLADALRLMIVFSDNTATNLVIDQIGLAATSGLMEQLDCPNTKLHSQVYRGDTSIAPDRSREFGLGSTTADEMVSLLVRIHERKLVSPEACDQMLGHLRACDDKSKIVSLLPPGTKVAHKTGAVSNSRTDAGLVESPSGTFAICILTHNNDDKSWTDENAANVLCGKIAKAAFDFFNADSTDPATADLAIGGHGELVETLQRTLNARLQPSMKLSIDGDFGPNTERAVSAFQNANGLTVSGVVDAATWRALSPLSEEGEVPPPNVVNSQKFETEPEDPLTGTPFVTCKAWVIVDAADGKQIAGSDEDQPLDPASTTKIMTAYVVLKMAEADPSLLDQPIVFSKTADDTVGSTARLKAGEFVSARELLYGLLLPSGNDASVAFAEHFGKQFLNSENEKTNAKSFDAFVNKMNETAVELGMKNTKYKNTHGLTELGHVASAADLAILARHAMQIPLFRTISSTRQRGCQVSSNQGYTRNVVWENTNRLLQISGYRGVKTGTTLAAGACLVSHATRDGKSLIAVVLGSESSSGRYADTRNLLRWGWQQLGASE